MSNERRSTALDLTTNTMLPTNDSQEELITETHADCLKDKVWTGPQDAFDACQEWAKEQGFSVNRARSCYTGDKHYCKVKCRHSGDSRCKTKCEATVAGVMTYIADDKGKIVSATSKEKQNTRRKLSEKFGCPFEIMLRPLKKGSNQWRVVSTKNWHNHEIALTISSYPMHRRLNNDQLQRAILMMDSGSSNGSIALYFTHEGHPCTTKDISNVRQRIFNNDPDHSMFHLIKSLEDDGYDVRYHASNEGGKRFLESICFAHSSAIELARKFPEIVSMDATYQTNRHKLPFMNVVGTGNIGFPSLMTFGIAAGWLSRETSANYLWFVKNMKEMVWPDSVNVSPKAFITDNQAALMNALDVVFPDAHKLLCQVHMRNTFRKHLRSQYSQKADYEALEETLNILMSSQKEDKASKMYVIPNAEDEEGAKEMFKKAAQKARNPKAVMEFLET